MRRLPSASSLVLGCALCLGGPWAACSSDEPAALDMERVPDSPGPARDSRPDSRPPDGPRPDRSTPDSKGPSGLSADEVVKACTILESCVLHKGVNSCLQQVWKDPQQFDSVMTCLAKTQGCAGVKSCLGMWMETSAVCPAGKNAMLCDGPKTWVICWSSTPATQVDCEKLYGPGATCTTYGQGAGCTTGAACTAGQGLACVGNEVAVCKDGKRFFTLDNACTAEGKTCVDGVCAGPAEACTESTCEGNTAAWCVQGRVLRKDCAAFGSSFACQKTSSGVTCSQGAECDFEGAYHKESCEGDDLVVCAAGKTVKVSCKGLGFSKCGLYECAP